MLTPLNFHPIQSSIKTPQRTLQTESIPHLTFGSNAPRKDEYVPGNSKNKAVPGRSEIHFSASSIKVSLSEALASLTLDEGSPESSTALITHRHEIGKIVKKIFTIRSLNAIAQKNFLDAVTFAKTSTNPEEVQMLRDDLDQYLKQLELYAGGSKAGYIFKRPQHNHPGENSELYKQAATQDRLQTALALHHHDADFQVKYDDRYMKLAMLITLIECEAKPVTKMASPEAEHLIGCYQKAIEELFGDVRSGQERTSEENKQLKHGYRKPSVQQGIEKAVANTEAIHEDAREIIEEDLHGTLDMIKSGESLKLNIQCVMKAINRAEISPQVKVKLLQSYRNFMTLEKQLQGIDLEKALKGKTVPRLPAASAEGLSAEHIAALTKMRDAKAKASQTLTITSGETETDQANQGSAGTPKKALSPEQKTKKNRAKYERQKRKRQEAQQAAAEQSGLSQS